MIDRLIKLETFSLSYDLEKMLINKAKYPRLMGFAPLFISSIGDAAVHGVTGFKKTLTGIVATPYNYFVSEENAYNETLTLKVAFMHLVMAIENVFNAVILPFINLYNPDKASQWIGQRIEANLKLFDRYEIFEEMHRAEMNRRYLEHFEQEPRIFYELPE